MPEVRETCCCGASHEMILAELITGNSATLAEFHRTHAPCREAWADKLRRENSAEFRTGRTPAVATAKDCKAEVGSSAVASSCCGARVNRISAYRYECTKCGRYRTDGGLRASGKLVTADSEAAASDKGAVVGEVVLDNPVTSTPACQPVPPPVSTNRLLEHVIEAKVSKCCGTPVHVENGMPDFIGQKGGVVTCWFVCDACCQPCDLVPAPDKGEA